MDQQTYQTNQREIRARNRARSEGVHHAAFENQVNVHQAISHDGVAECQRKNAERKYGDFHPITGQFPEQEWHRIENRKWYEGENRSARHPLQLLAQNRAVGPLIAVQEYQRSSREI